MSKVTSLDGCPIVDATKPIIVKITKRDIAKAKRRAPDCCVAAQALIRSFGKAKVHLTRTYVKKGNKWLRFQTSIHLKHEIIAYDRGGQFATGEYALLPMPSYMKSTGKRQGSKPKYTHARKNPNRRKRLYIHTQGVRKHAGFDTNK